MNQGIWLVVYGALLAESCFVAIALVPLTMRLALRFGFVAYPGGRHIHARPMPVLGGVAIVGSFLIVLIGNLAIAHFFHDTIREQFPGVGKYLVNIPSIFTRLGVVVGGAGVMFIMGLIDDKRALGPRIKLIFMILAALALVFSGVRVQGFLPWPWAGSVVTVLWVVFLTNSFNFLDNMDGLTAGVGAIVTLAFALISFFAGEWFITAIYAVLAGGLLGFLWHNFSPARTFMGDNGALFTGFMIGSLSVLATYYRPGVPTALPVLAPLIVLGFPIFDTVSVLWIRWRAGKPLMQGDKNHFSHRLRDLGMSSRQAVTFIYVITAAIALAAIPLGVVGRVGGVVILIQTALLFWIIYYLERTARNRSAQSK